VPPGPLGGHSLRARRDADSRKGTPAPRSRGPSPAGVAALGAALTFVWTAASITIPPILVPFGAALVSAIVAAGALMQWHDA
jgi:hypothetical protein